MARRSGLPEMSPDEVRCQRTLEGSGSITWDLEAGRLGQFDVTLATTRSQSTSLEYDQGGMTVEQELVLTHEGTIELACTLE